MQASIQVRQDAQVQYLLRIADTALVLAQRISEWSGHAPVLEEDIALSNMAIHDSRRTTVPSRQKVSSAPGNWRIS